jgi:hypothetical protein
MKAEKTIVGAKITWGIGVPPVNFRICGISSGAGGIHFAPMTKKVGTVPGKGKNARIERRIGSFMQQYQRRAQRNSEPNDRGYDRKLEKQIKRLPPEDLSELLSGDGDDE